jgi:pyrroloquinoline quinone (PQQ) biosynthesis protein C
MNHDSREKAPRADDDDAHTEEAKRVVEDYTRGLREMLRRLRKLVPHDTQ